MAAEAQTLLTDTAWLPEPLRTLGRAIGDEPAVESIVEETPEQPSENKLEDEEERTAHNQRAGEQIMAAE
ncbi:hypothetical protein ABIA09_005614 [Bradyrhizobium yuanmingense]